MLVLVLELLEELELVDVELGEIELGEVVVELGELEVLVVGIYITINV